MPCVGRSRLFPRDGRPRLRLALRGADFIRDLLLNPSLHDEAGPQRGLRATLDHRPRSSHCRDLKSDAGRPFTGTGSGNAKTFDVFQRGNRDNNGIGLFAGTNVPITNDAVGSSGPQAVTGSNGNTYVVR
jgi:hypothetical protein